MIVQLNENVKCNAKRKIKNICIYLLLFFFAFAIIIRYQQFGALAQLVEQAFRCLSPVPILHRKAVNVKSAQNLAGIFGAIAQLVARYIRIVEVRGSNPLSSTKIVREHSFRTIILYHLSKHQSCKRNESRNMQDIRS